MVFHRNKMRFVGSEALCRVSSFPCRNFISWEREKITSNDFESSCFDTSQNLTFAFLVLKQLEPQTCFPQLFPVMFCQVQHKQTNAKTRHVPACNVWCSCKTVFQSHSKQSHNAQNLWLKADLWWKGKELPNTSEPIGAMGEDSRSPSTQSQIAQNSGGSPKCYSKMPLFPSPLI